MTGRRGAANDQGAANDPDAAGGRGAAHRWLRRSAAGIAAVTIGIALAGCTGSAGSAADAAAGMVSAAAGPSMAGPSEEAAPTRAAGVGAGDQQGSGGHVPAAGPPSNAAASEPDAAPEPGSPSGSAADPGGTGTGADVNLVTDRQIIRTASIALQVTAKPGKDDAATTAELAQAAASAATRIRALGPGSGGYVSASDGGGDTISITLRIPAASYATVMTDLSGIGEVMSRTEKTDDVTDQMIDVASRVASMRASVDRIRLLLTKADKIGDVISIESELASREADLESLENRQTALKGQVTLSTITVTISAVTPTQAATAQVRQPTGFLAGLAGGWHALEGFGTGLAAVVGALLPFSPLIVAAVLVLIWGSRRRRRALAAGPAVPSAVPSAAPSPAGPSAPSPPSPPSGS